MDVSLRCNSPVDSGVMGVHKSNGRVGNPGPVRHSIADRGPLSSAPQYISVRNGTFEARNSLQKYMPSRTARIFLHPTHVGFGHLKPKWDDLAVLAGFCGCGVTVRHRNGCLQATNTVLN